MILESELGRHAGSFLIGVKTDNARLLLYNVKTKSKEADMAKTASLTMRIEPDVKASAEELFASMGITLTEAINMFVYKSLAVGGIPFDLKQPRWNKETLEAFKEGDKIAKGEIEAKRYTDVDQMFDDILSGE